MRMATPSAVLLRCAPPPDGRPRTCLCSANACLASSVDSTRLDSRLSEVREYGQNEQRARAPPHPSDRARADAEAWFRSTYRLHVEGGHWVGRSTMVRLRLRVCGVRCAVAVRWAAGPHLSTCCNVRVFVFGAAIPYYVLVAS